MAVRLQLPLKKAPNPTDEHVGARVQEREAGFSAFATESARKLQEREAEFSAFATESARKLQDHATNIAEAIHYIVAREELLTH